MLFAGKIINSSKAAHHSVDIQVMRVLAMAEFSGFGRLIGTRRCSTDLPIHFLQSLKPRPSIHRHACIPKTVRAFFDILGQRSLSMQICRSSRKSTILTWYQFAMILRIPCLYAACTNYLL